MLGVTRATLSNLINGRAGISPEMAIRLGKAFGGSPETWLKLQMQYDLAQALKNEAALKVQRVTRPAARANQPDPAPEIFLQDIYRTPWPFVLMEIAPMRMVMTFPESGGLWPPQVLVGGGQRQRPREPRPA